MTIEQLGIDDLAVDSIDPLTSSGIGTLTGDVLDLEAGSEGSLS